MASACANGAPLVARALGRTFARFFARTTQGPPLRVRTDRLRAIAGALAILCSASAVEAQTQGSWFERLGIDKLKFTGLGLQIGRVNPHGIQPATSYSLQADY